MQPLSDNDVLELWERGQRHSRHGRAMLLTEAALSELDTQACAQLPIGRRDTALLRLRMLTYGSTAACFLACPSCREDLEFELELDRLVLEPPDSGASSGAVEYEGWSIAFGLPTTLDLHAVSVLDPGSARQALIGRLVTQAVHEGMHIAVDELPDEVISLLEHELDRIDPQADVRLSQNCPACAHRFVAPFDIAEYLWTELDAHARELMREVHALARAYGWTEPDVLSLTRARRHAYLELCGAR